MSKVKRLEIPAAGDRLTFRGCSWDAHWEFDCPCVVYSPVQRYSPNHGNSGGVDSLVEDICIDLCLGRRPEIKFRPVELHEFKWRGWSPERFARRKLAFHVEIVVEFFDGKDGLEFKVISRKERFKGQLVDDE